MNSYVKQDDKLVLTGDFNLPNINGHTFSSYSVKSAENVIADLAFNFDFLQVVKEFTRIQNDSRSTLYLFLVSGSIKDSISCSVTAGISDHKAVVLTPRLTMS